MRPCPSCASRSPEELFDQVYDLTDLQQQARNCNICSLLEESLHRKGIRAPKVVALQQDAAHVRLRNGPNLLSLYSEPGEQTLRLVTAYELIQMPRPNDTYRKWCTTGLIGPSQTWFT